MSVLFILYAFSCFCLTFSRIALYLIQNISYNAVIVRRVSWLSGWLFAVIFFFFQNKRKTVAAASQGLNYCISLACCGIVLHHKGSSVTGCLIQLFLLHCGAHYCFRKRWSSTSFCCVRCLFCVWVANRWTPLGSACSTSSSKDLQTSPSWCYAQKQLCSGQFWRGGS